MALLFAVPTWARTPEVAVDPREGVWITAGEVFVQQARDRWSVFPTEATVNQLVVDDLTVWAATDDGVIRFETGSRRMSGLSMDDGLPSQAVSAVAADDTYLWFGTNKGLARYRKLDRTIRVYTAEDGLPHRAVTDLQTLGRQIWVGTRAGLAVYDPEFDGLRAYTVDDGLGSDYIEELYALGDDLWCRTDTGLSRFRPSTLRFTNFGFEDIGGQQIRVFAPDGERVWVGTENGIAIFETQSDAFITFPQQSALESQSIVGIEPFSDYLFIVTEKQVVQYHKVNRSFRPFTAADGMAREAGALGSLLSGGLLTLLFDDGAEVYDIQRDLWISRSLAATETTGDESGGASWQLLTKLDSEVPIDLRTGKADDERYGTAVGGAGVGYQSKGGRSLDISTLLDYGEVELKGIRDGQIKAEYLGTQEDVVREVRLQDKLKLDTLEEGIETPVWLAGGRGRLASEGAEPTVSATIDAGLRRGISVRDFLTGPRQEIYALSQRYILPGSERVYLDGELLTSGKDYTLIYPAGQLAFLDPERVDDLSIIEVEYEYDVMPRKGLGVISLLDLLPADNEVGAWARASEPTMVSEESGLYAQINGAAPKYIDRGWVRSVFVEYRQGSRNIQISIHDMGDPGQSKDIYDYDLPAARESVEDRDNIVLDLGLATSYAIKANEGSFYIELSIDEKSDPAKQSLKLFAIQVLDRGTSAGEHKVDALRETLVSARTAVSPMEGLEVGARIHQLTGIRDPKIDARAREQLMGMVDSRYERAFGEGGRLTGYLEGAGSHGQRAGDRDGWAGMGRLRFSHPWAEGAVSGRYMDSNYAPMGSKETLHGELKSRARLQTTAYPTRWLPATVFFTREESRVAGQKAPGQTQHALARLQLAHRDAPATRLQVGHSLLDDGAGIKTERRKGVAQADYDLAEGVLKPLGLRRFILGGYYGISAAETRSSGHFRSGDRVQVARAEAKLAPTATETAYALFRTRSAKKRTNPRDALALSLRHWELNAGARSAIIPGLVPQVNHSVIFDDDRLGTDGPVKRASASISGQLGIFPGDWIGALAPVAIDSRYSVANEEKAENRLRTVFHRLHRVDNRMSYNGMGQLQVELHEIYEVSLAGQTRARVGQRLELRNRVIYRPIHVSPITLRLDYVDARTANDGTVESEAPRWGRQVVYEGALEWLMRWDTRSSTKLKCTLTRGRTRNLLVLDEATERGQVHSFVQHQVKPELELRFLLQQDSGSLFLVERNRFFTLFGTGIGATEAMGFDVALGAIWSYADNVYLDAEIAYQQSFCKSEPCTPTRVLTPRLLLTAKL